MPAGNAFADGTQIIDVRHLVSATVENGHARKKQKTAEVQPQASIFTKTGDPDVSLEVDHMILDYLSYQATNAVLGSRKSGSTHATTLERKLVVVDTFLEAFRAKHPRYKPDSELRFRLLLLQFTALFALRLSRNSSTPSPAALHELREQNLIRARTWISSADNLPSLPYPIEPFTTNLPLPVSSLENHSRAAFKAQAPKTGTASYDKSFYGTSDSIALLDILPSFMSVIAARNELSNSNISKSLMGLVADFMLQACLEQYLVRGASGSDAIDEAFAWGYEPALHPLPHDETIRMFQTELELELGDVQVPGWSSIKRDCISSLVEIREGEGLEGHLREVQSAFPLERFERTMLGFLGSLAESLPLPVLVQLEGGRLEGMDGEETKAFLKDCGLGGRYDVGFEEDDGVF